MVDPIAPTAPAAPISIMNTPPVAPKPPEAVLFPTTPTGTPPATPAIPVTPEPPAAGKPPATPPVTSPAKPSEPPKEPTEPKKPEVPATPATPPADYEDLKLPDGSLLSAEKQATLVKEAKASGLSKEKAQELLSSHEAVAKETASAIKAQQDKALEAAKVLWKGEVEKDPVLGGEHITETALLSSRGYQALTTPEERKAIEQTGMDFHPIFVRMMAKVGKLLGEDNRLVLGQIGAPTEDLSTTEAKAAKMYGKTTPGANGQKTS